MTMVGAAAIAIVVSVVASPGQQMGIRAVLWGAAALVAIFVAPGRRPEPVAAWGCFGTGMALIAFAWSARALNEPLQQLGRWPALPAAVGLGLLALGLFYAGRGPRERTALFDGALLAGAVATVAWAVLIAPRTSEATGTAALAAAVGHVLGGVLVLGVGAALMLADRDTKRVVGTQLSLLLVSVQMAAVGWAWQGLAGHDQAIAGAASWILAPLMAIAMATTKEAELPDLQAPGRPLTRARFRVLVGLTILPAVLVGLMAALSPLHDREVPVLMGLWVTVGSVVVLALRIRALGYFAVEDERATASTRFGHLIEHSADVVAVVSPDGVIRYVSPSTKRIFAHDPDALVGRHVSHFIDDASPERVLRLLQIAVEGQGRPVPIRIGILAGDGLSRPAEGSITDLTSIPSVAGLVVTLRDVSARVALEADLRRAALEDPLTGLDNRTLFTDRLQHALGQQVRGGFGVAVLFADLDDFKRVNDTHGHAAGDRVLRLVADRLRKVVRDVDTVGRIGGDEFAIVLEGLPPSDVLAAAQEVVDRLFEELANPIAVAGDWVQVSVSVGIAVATPGMTLEALLQNADMAMYSAKAGGGSTSSVFGPGMSSPLAHPPNADA